jgi:hypothetical protein
VIGGVFGDHTEMKTARVLLFCTVATMAACHRDSDQGSEPVPTPHVSVPAAVRKGPSAADLTVGMVEAASQGKSQVPVQLKFDLPRRPIVGQPIDINIAVLPQIDANAGAIQVTGGEGLTVAPGMSQIELPLVDAGQVYRQGITVNASTTGVLLLNLTVLLKHDELAESRAFSIPLIVDR